MKVFKKGFTLTEVLITVGIIGIIGSLTIPKLVDLTGSRITGASVGRAVELVEGGVKNIFDAAQSHGVMAINLSALTLADVYGSTANLGAGVNLADFIASGDNLFRYAGKYMGTERTNGAYLANAVLYNGNPLVINNATVYKFVKSDINLIVGQIDAINNADANDNNRIITRIYIDGNGETPPNTLGIDIFLFGLSNSGKMIPAGVNEYNNNIFNENVGSYRDECMANITDGRACSARLVNDGWRINY